MKNSVKRILALMLPCAVGGVLIGINAGQLSKGVNAGLFVLGIAMISLSTSCLGLLETAWKRREQTKNTDPENQKRGD